MTLEQYERVTITELARAGLFNGEHNALTVSAKGEKLAHFLLAADGTRVYVVDAEGTAQAFRIIWKPSPLGGKYPLFLDNKERPCRILYRARNGWGSRKDFKGSVLYRSQTRSRYQREGIGRLNGLILLCRLEGLVYEPNRKWTYRGKETPHYKRVKRMWRRVFHNEPFPI